MHCESAVCEATRTTWTQRALEVVDCWEQDAREHLLAGCEWAVEELARCRKVRAWLLRRGVR